MYTLGDKEVGEPSGSKPYSEEVWAKLVPSDSSYPDFRIRSNLTSVSSKITSTSLDEHEWCQIERNSDLCSAMIKNKSSSTIFVDGAAIHNDDTAHIKSGSKIVPGPSSEGHLFYKFEIMPLSEQSCQKKLKISIDAECTKCCICLNVWHDVVTVGPCLHNFCNGCLSEWLKRSKAKRSVILCPQCRGVVQFVGRNHFLHNIEEDILQADKSLRRSVEELGVLNSYATIKSNLVIPDGNMGGQKRARSSANEESDDSNFGSDDEYSCPQCDTEVNGFRCNPNTVHLQCSACGGMMPSRIDLGIPQHCFGCDLVFCGAYWHAQTISGFHAVCSSETFKPISEYRMSVIPSIVHESNGFEQGITERCIRQLGRTIHDVVSEWVRKLDNREIDRSRMPLNHAELITSASYMCIGCYYKLVSFLLYWFRVTLPRDRLPSDVSSREDCWYGYACRTQHHNLDHARKYNHVCRSIRGSQSSTSRRP